MKHLRRRDVVPPHQAEFSPVLFDVLFGLLMFMNLGWLLMFRDATQFFFYIIAIVTVVHWWLKYKSEESAYGLDVQNSTFDLLCGIGELILLAAAVQAAARAEYVVAIFYFSLPLLTEAVWAMLWRVFGSWKRSTRQKAGFLQTLLERTVLLDICAAAVIGALLSLHNVLTPFGLVCWFGVAQAAYMLFASLLEIVEVRLF